MLPPLAAAPAQNRSSDSDPCPCPYPHTPLQWATLAHSPFLVLRSRLEIREPSSVGFVFLPQLVSLPMPQTHCLPRQVPILFSRKPRRLIPLASSRAGEVRRLA